MDKTVITLNQGWKFFYGECEEAWYRGFCDEDWRSVMVPHDWAVEQPFSKQYSSGTGYLCGGIGWYRLHVRIPKEWEKKSISVVFDGVYKNSQVWINSYYLGKHPNGYTGFSYDISEQVFFGEDNVICVKVSHTDLADSRWYTGSGITRKVMLVAQERIHPVENGIFLDTLSIGKKEAVISILEEVENRQEKSCEVKLEAALMAEDGTKAAGVTKTITLAPGERKIIRFEKTLGSPKLWSVQQPNRYDLLTWYEVDKERYLADSRKVGIRTIRFDADHGFFLNEQAMKLKGVCLHHDAGCLGAAVTKEIWQRRLEKLAECGCNAIRCSHNPHMPELYELCDEMGFLVMDEAFDEWENAKNKWSTGHNVYPPKHQGYFEDFPEWHERDLRAMVRRDRSHPSVILWSIGNEIDYPNDPYCHPMFENMTGNNDANKPAAERQYDKNKPNAERMVTLAKELSGIVKSEDESRPVTMALAFPELSAGIGIFDALDVAGYNYKEHLYEKDHEEFAKMPLLGSENGHSYDAWRMVREHEYICGQFLWTGIDYLGEAHGWPIHGSAAGLLDCGGMEKEQFWFRKSLWCKQPVLKLATRGRVPKEDAWLPFAERWNYQPGEEITVHCYSNLAAVRLFLNGKEQGTKNARNEEGVFSFDLKFEQGTLLAEGYDEQEELVLTTQLSTEEKPSSIRLSLWKGADKAGQETFWQVSQQVGYLYQITAELLDGKNRKTDAQEQEISVNVEGAGELMGLENGNLCDVTSYSSQKRKTQHGTLIAYIRRTGAGKIKAVFEAEGLGGETVEMEMD